MLKVCLSFFLIGLSFGLGPCLVSCGPLLLSYSAGNQKNSLKSALVYLLFSFSRMAVYVILSLVVFFFGQAITEHVFASFSRYIFIFSGIFVIFIGILMALGKHLEHKFCRQMQSWFLKKDAKTIIILGLITGIMPCGPLIAILSYIGLIAKSWFYSLLCGFSFGLGTVFSPLFILVVFSGFIPRVVKDNLKFYQWLNLVCGLAIVFLGVQLVLRGR